MDPLVLVAKLAWEVEQAWEIEVYNSGASCSAGLGGDEVEEAPDSTNRIFPGFLGATGFLREEVLASLFCLPLSVSLAFLVGGASLFLGGLPPFLFLLGSLFSFPSL